MPDPGNWTTGIRIGFGKPTPPDGLTAEEWFAQNKEDGFGKPSETLMEHRRRYEETTEGPILTWREMAICGWDDEKAQAHRGNTWHQAAKSMQEARKKLRAQGWSFTIDRVPTPPPEKDNRYAMEVANAQRKSNWYMRLPANAR